MHRNLSSRDFDWVLLGLVLLICALGVLEIYSATHGTKFAGAQMKQVYWIGFGLVLMYLISRVDYHTLLDYSHWAYGLSILSLVAVAVVGRKYLGAKRWIALPGGQHFQPSEWVKLILILALAKYFTEMHGREVTVADIVKTGMLAAVPMLLVLKQPDLGTALTYVPILVMALFLGGMKWKQAAVILLAVGLALPVVWHFGLKPYQKARLTSFADPQQDPQGSGYQIEQSLIAVGSGGIWGQGLARGTQVQGAFLPVPQTDFIFAAFAEEHGFVGAMLVLLLYFIVLMRLIHNAQTAPDRAGAFVVMGVVAILAFHILVNIGMVVGFMPVTGIPLPLMSAGGSAVLFTFLALGIVMNIRMKRFVN